MKGEFVVAKRSNLGFFKMAESNVSRILRDPRNPLRLRREQLSSRRVKKRKGQDDPHKEPLMKKSEVLRGVPGSLEQDRSMWGL